MSEEAEKSRRDRGYEDGFACRPPTEVSTSYIDGYIEGRKRRFGRTIANPSTFQLHTSDLELRALAALLVSSPFERAMAAAGELAAVLRQEKDHMTDEERMRVLDAAFRDEWCTLCGDVAGCMCAPCYDE